MNAATRPTAEPDARTGPQRSWIVRKFQANPWIFFFAFGVVVLTIYQLVYSGSKDLSPLPNYGSVAEFSLTDATGAPFGSDALQGKVWIASFFFTSCQTVCPRLMTANGDLQDMLADQDVDGVELVSFSVDPEVDTPEVLTSYGARYGVDPKRWHLLTGDRATIGAVAESLNTAMGDKVPNAEGVPDIVHSSKVALVDARGHLRYYFDPHDPKERQLLVGHARKLVAEREAQ